MNVETVTLELADASVEELAQTLRLIADRSLALHDTVVIDRKGRAVLMHIRRNVGALADTLYDLAATQKAALQGRNTPIWNLRYRQLIKAGGGSVINMSSNVALMGVAGRDCYTAAERKQRPWMM